MGRRPEEDPSLNREPRRRPSPSVEELLAGVAVGDKGSLGALYDAVAPGLLALARQILPGREEAGAAADEVFLKLVSESAGLAGSGASATTWLTLAVRQAAVARLRSRRQLPKLPGHPALARSFAWLPGAREIQQLDERRGLLAKVMNQLPPHQTEVLEAAVFGGLTEEEIARKVGEPLGQARSELRAAVRFLRHRWRAVTGLWVANI